MTRTAWLVAGMLTAPVALTGCLDTGSDSSSSDDSGPSLTDQIEVVSSKNDTGTSSLASLGTLNFDESGTDYAQTETTRWVMDPSLFSLNQLDNIVCLMRNVRPGEMAGEGDYIASIQNDLCFEGSRSSKTHRWMVNVLEATETEPVRVRVEALTDINGISGVKMYGEIKEAPNDANPNGVFTMNYYEDGGSWEGKLQALATGDDGQAELTWYETGSGSGTLKLWTSYEPVGGEIDNGQIEVDGFGDGTLDWKADFATDLFHRYDNDADSETCLDRAETNAYVLSSSLFYKDDATYTLPTYSGSDESVAASAGDLVEITPGVPFEVETGASKEFGYVTDSGFYYSGGSGNWSDFTSDADDEGTGYYQATPASFSSVADDNGTVWLRQETGGSTTYEVYPENDSGNRASNQLTLVKPISFSTMMPQDASLRDYDDGDLTAGNDTMQVFYRGPGQLFLWNQSNGFTYNPSSRGSGFPVPTISPKDGSDGPTLSPSGYGGDFVVKATRIAEVMQGTEGCGSTDPGLDASAVDGKVSQDKLDGTTATTHDYTFDSPDSIEVKVVDGEVQN